jgi:hypothetical protein
MKLPESTLIEQLKILHGKLDALVKHQASIKTWTVTIWVTLLAALAAQKIVLPSRLALFSMASPVVLMWFLDSVHGGIILLLSTQIREIEERLANGELEVQSPGEVFILARYGRYTMRNKANAFIHAVFAETNALFFVGLLVATYLATRFLLP